MSFRSILESLKSLEKSTFVSFKRIKDRFPSLIASTFIAKKGDLPITNNIDHFRRIDEVSNKVISAHDFIKRY